MRTKVSKNNSADTSARRLAVIQKPSMPRIIESPSNMWGGLFFQRAAICPCDGGCPQCAPVIQPKPQIGQPDDKYEQEADRVADQVMQMSDKLTGEITSTELARGKPISTGAKPSIKSFNRENTNIFNKLMSLERRGQPLSKPLREQFDNQFSYEFSSVRIHHGPDALQLARFLNAKAFTYKNDIVFCPNMFAPETSSGKRLLAHELTHVVQQNQSRGAKPDCIQRDEGEEEWIQDRNGNLYYENREQAEFRMKTLKELGEYKKFKITAFELKGKTYYKVEMSGPMKLAAPPEAVTTPPASSGSAGTAPKPSGKGASRTVCLTFDDGPQSGTADVLDVLKSFSAPATFFLTGKNMASKSGTQKKLLEDILTAKEGHKIGNHTYSHDPMTPGGYRSKYSDLSDPTKLKKFEENYEKNLAYFQKLMKGSKVSFPGFKLARLPGSGSHVKVKGKLIYVDATIKMGMAYIAWQFEFAPNGVFGHLKILDWKGVKGVAAELNHYPRASSIILFHDRHWAGSNRLLLGNILSALIADGCNFGRLSDSGKCEAAAKPTKDVLGPGDFPMPPENVRYA